jgi:hypothetical protein
MSHKTNSELPTALVPSSPVNDPQQPGSHCRHATHTTISLQNTCEPESCYRDESDDDGLADSLAHSQHMPALVQAKDLATFPKVFVWYLTLIMMSSWAFRQERSRRSSSSITIEVRFFRKIRILNASELFLQRIKITL